ncbi:MAG: ACT domain-containing protein [Phycisphaerales bacterium]|nr:MAG: ACT domain-containing protein [Phycisphaerales bacterium]
MTKPGYAHDEIIDIASADGLCAIHVSKYMMNREIGFGRRLLQILEEEQLSFEYVPSGLDNLSVILDSRSFTAQKERSVMGRIETELCTDDVVIEHGLSLISIDGKNTSHSADLVATACTALADAGVNIEMINQGSSQTGIVFGVKETDRKRAVQALARALNGKDGTN